MVLMTLVVLALIVALAAGCGDGSAPKASGLATVLHERYGVPTAQADCIARGLFHELSTSELRKLRSADQIADLPAKLQRDYTHALDSLQQRCTAARSGSRPPTTS